MEIHATTTYDYELIRDLTRYTMFRNPITNGIKWSIIMLPFGFMLVGLLSFVIHNGFTVFGSFLFIAVIIAARYVDLYIWAAKRTYKKDPSLNMLENSFVFRNDSSFLKVNSTLNNSSGEINYSTFFKVCETSKYFYLFIDTKQTYVLKKSDIIDGTPEQIGAILQNYIPKKKYFIKK